MGNNKPWQSFPSKALRSTDLENALTSLAKKRQPFVIALVLQL